MTGLADFRAGRFAEAILDWQAAADAGDPRASLYLGVLFDTGQGVARDTGKAFDWYRRAADAGNAVGAFNVGVFYDSGLGVPQDRRLAAQWYGRAAAQGFGRADYNLAMLYEAGVGVPRNLARATELYRLAAAKGISAARGHLVSLGERAAAIHPPVVDTALKAFQEAQGLLLGRGLLQATQAADLFQRSAEQGNPLAAYDLAYCYEHGIGVLPDSAQAYTWYRRAALQASDPTLKTMAQAGVDSVAGRMTDQGRRQAAQIDP